MDFREYCPDFHQIKAFGGAVASPSPTPVTSSAEYQTAELSSACQKVVSTNLLNYEGMFEFYYLIREFFLLCERFFPPCRISVLILRQGRTTVSNSVYRCFLGMMTGAIFRKASTKSILLYHNIFK